MQLKKRAMSLLFCVNRVVFAMSASRCYEYAGTGFGVNRQPRPEIAHYRSLNANAFNGNANAGVPPSRNWAAIAASDLIFHF